MLITRIHVVGAGLAGSEAAYSLAEAGFDVVLHEMRPDTLTPAHKTAECAELVCSNSFKSQSPVSAPGMLKSEMRELNSLILKVAAKCSVPAGEALGVDREQFASQVTEALRTHPRITFEAGEVQSAFDDGITLIATGPLTSEKLGEWLIQVTGEGDLYFYDAIAPIVDATSIDLNSAFLANRYDKGEEQAYLNCPMNEQEYGAFVSALLAGQTVPPKDFEKEIFFQGCQPIEAIAGSGEQTLRFGPMKPVGLVDPKTGRQPYAVVQLRPENASKTAYNLVGFQTKLKYGDQSKIFRLIPALAQAEFLRMGSIHRNTYVCGPKVLRSNLSLKGKPNVFLAGQVCGVEGYLESAACGALASIFIQQQILGLPYQAPPANTALGALLRHVVGSNPERYSPNNMHFGLFEQGYFDGVVGLKKDEARKTMAAQSIENFKAWRVRSMPKTERGLTQ